MTTFSASLQLRPTRLGFLVNPNDIESINRIFQVCTCLWGGLYNPIIPVCSELPTQWLDPIFPSPSPSNLAQGYIDFFEPDAFVEATPGLANTIGLQQSEFDFHRPRIIALNTFFEADPQRRSLVPFGTSVLPIYKDLFDRDFKFLHRLGPGVAAIEADADSKLFANAMFGGFPSEGPLAPMAQAYLDAFDPVKLNATAENWVKIVTDGLRSPLLFTRERIKREPGGFDEPTIFIVDQSSTLDMIDLWNIRQFRASILPISLSWFREAKDFVLDFVKRNYRPLPHNNNGVMIYPTLQFGRSISKETAEEITKAIGLHDLTDTRWSFKLWYDQIWKQNVDRDHVAWPKRANISAGSNDIELTLAKSDNDLHCQFTSLSPEFAETYDDAAARWVNVLKIQTPYGGGDNIAYTLPTTFGEGDPPHLRLGDPTIFSREGFVLPQKYKHHREYFRLMTGKDALINWLGRRGVKATPSDPGRIVDQILISMHGFHGSQLLADRDTLKLLDDMSKSVKRHADGKEEEFPDRSVEAKRWKALVDRRNQQGLMRISLDNFIKANVFRLGLVLACPNCLKKNWYAVDQLKLSVICERCLSTFDFPQGSLALNATPWHYRVAGPFSVPNYAEGAYATVLSLRAFALGFGSHDTKLTYATGLNFESDDGINGEVDFTFWYQRGRMFDSEEDPTLVFGEAKSFGTEAFKENDVVRMKQIAEKFPGSTLVFATLKNVLGDAEKALITPLALWGRELLPNYKHRAEIIVLTGVELFSSWHIQDSWKEHGGMHAVFAGPGHLNLENLSTLANCTQQLYLDLPDFHAAFRASVAANASATPEP